MERDWRRWPISARSVQNNQYRVLGLGTTVIQGGGTLSTGVRHGQPLYLANFYVFTKWFPWFADARDWISIFTHLVQGGLWAYLYKILARRAVTEVR